MAKHPKPPRCKRPDETTEDYRVAMGWDQAEPPHCPKCGTHEVSQQQTCHNSACEAYAHDVTIYEGWNVQKSSLFVAEPGEKQELPRKPGADGDRDTLRTLWLEWLEGLYDGPDLLRRVKLAVHGPLRKPGNAGAEAAGNLQAEALRGLRNLKVLLGTDSPEVRGWAPAVQQAAQRSVTAAIRVLVTSGVKENSK